MTTGFTEKQLLNTTKTTYLFNGQEYTYKIFTYDKHITSYSDVPMQIVSILNDIGLCLYVTKTNGNLNYTYAINNTPTKYSNILTNTTLTTLDSYSALKNTQSNYEDEPYNQFTNLLLINV